ncbi:retrovirus-related pol polyprotein from transposon TNT 1-94, partial [Tanacetum coccineum]
MMLDSIDNGPLVYPTIEEDGQTQPKKYSELTEAQQLQDDCDVQATNIILHDLPPDVYALVNHQEAAKDIWDKVKLLMKGTELSYQERECSLYNLFDKYASVQASLSQYQVLNALPPEWSKFVTDVKLAKSLYTTNYDQLYAYLSQHERHAQKVRVMRERYPVTQQSQNEFPQLDSSLVVPTFQQGDDPIECINKAIAFLSIVASRLLPSNHHLRTGIAITSKGNYAAGQSKFMKCYNCLGEGHMAKQCTQPKRPRNSAWFKEKLMLVEVQEAEVQVAQQTIPQNSAFQTESDCDDLSSAKAVLMANLSSCDSDVLSE